MRLVSEQLQALCTTDELSQNASKATLLNVSWICWSQHWAWDHDGRRTSPL
jgi:hypothetical protein